MNRTPWALAALCLSGCLGSPAERTCADFPRDTPECADYWGDADGGTPDGVVPDDGIPPPDDGIPPPDDGITLDDGTPPVDDGIPPVDDGIPPPDDGIPPPDDGLPPPDDGVPPPDDGVPPDMGARECEPGATQTCGSDVGACRFGVQVCDEDGSFDVPCQGGVAPADVEACDGVDDDCDGMTDEGCDCVDGEREACGSDVGACVAGERACMGGVFGACVGRVEPSVEVCNSVDDDCNGIDDDVPGLGIACQVGIGECRRDGTLVCRAASEGEPVCSAIAGAARPEQCNGRDEDCDGTSDEGLQPQVQPTDLGPSEDARPAIAVNGEFFGAVWISEGSTPWFALLSGRQFEIDPYAIERYDSGDVDVEGVALEGTGGNGFVLGVGYGDVGGTGVEITRIDQAGGFGATTWFSNADAADDITLAWNGTGVGAAWSQDTRDAAGNHAIAFAHLANFPNRANEILLPNNRTHHSAPALAWSGDRYGLAYVQSERPGAAGTLEFRLVNIDGSVRNAVTISRTVGAAAPVMRWLAVNRRFVVAWTEPEGRNVAVRAVFLDAEGAIVEGPIVFTGSAAASPALMPIEPGAGRAAEEIMVAWVDAGLNNQRVMRLGRLLRGRDAWQTAPLVYSLFFPRAAFPHLVGAWSIDSGTDLLVVDFDGRTRTARSITGNFGCAISPR
ncbi:MAG: hypothetical protein H6703_16390 [Myxococcales bacterium]|nr:hypothetical protein [Myxococcales bacterium]